ncbi:MAG: RNA-binding S4 domain-containing protein [Alphaproteobacteria bacterium]|nr:RNA-binding S4 domain-containing protein [Alphaproteobacteria bacterium]
MSEDDRLRLDKWLWRARFAKTRALAAKMIEGGGFRLNSQPIRKSHQGITAGDVLTLPLDRRGTRIMVVRVLALGQRRGPASEAATLYVRLDEG